MDRGDSSAEKRKTMLDAFSETVNTRWPMAKFSCLGLYSAWILIMVTGSSSLLSPSELASNQASGFLYLYSGIPLCVVLIGCGLAGKRVEPFIKKGSLVPMMGLVAAVCTFLVMGGAGQLGYTGFTIACVGTGLGTAFLCLRIGLLFSTLSSERAFFDTLASAVFGNFVFFMYEAVTPFQSVLVVSALPLAAALVASTKHVRVEKDDADTVPVDLLPRGFFGRAIIFIFVFSLAVGASKGATVLVVPADVARESLTNSVLASLAVKAVLLVALALVIGTKKYDVSKIYYPVIIVAALGMLLFPLLGEDFMLLEVTVLNTAYNIFIVILWCMFANLAGQTTLGSVRVFGLGRGASALGTTIGQAMALFVMAPSSTGGVRYSVEAAVVLAVLVLVCAIVVLDERTVSAALEKTFRKEREAGASSEPEDAGDRTIGLVAERFGLTAREREMFGYLVHGRTASFIASDLGISYNTAKGHIKNLYAKCGVHSRQELIDLSESAGRELRAVRSGR